MHQGRQLKKRHRFLDFLSFSGVFGGILFTIIHLYSILHYLRQKGMTKKPSTLNPGNPSVNGLYCRNVYGSVEFVVSFPLGFGISTISRVFCLTWCWTTAVIITMSPLFFVKEMSSDT